MLREQILDYLYEINARCDYAIEDVADDIVDMVDEELKHLHERERSWHNVIGF